MKGEREPGHSRQKEVLPYQESFVHKETFPNGMRVLVHEMPDAQFTTAWMVINAGPRYENAATNGATHFLEHQLFQGSKKFPSEKALRKHVWEAGGWTGSASTGKEFVEYLTAFDSDKLDVGLDYLDELVYHPILSASSIELERERIKQERAEWMDAPFNRLSILIDKHAWGDHPVGQDTLGSLASLQAITREDLAAYHDHFYTPDNSILVIAGGVTADQAIKTAKDTFGDLPKGTEKKAHVPLPTQSPENRVLIEEQDLNQTYIGLTFDTNGNGLSSEILPEIEVLSSILDTTIVEKLTHELGYSYRASAYPHVISDAGKIVLLAGVAHENTDKAVQAMIDLVKDMHIDEATLEEAKVNVGNKYLFGANDTSSFANYIALQEFFQEKVISPEEKRANIQTISLEDIRKLQETLLRGENAGLVVLGNVPSEKKKAFEEMLDFDQK